MHTNSQEAKTPKPDPSTPPPATTRTLWPSSQVLAKIVIDAFQLRLVDRHQGAGKIFGMFRGQGGAHADMACLLEP